MRNLSSCSLQHLSISLASAASLLLAGCGGSDDASSTGSEETQAAVVDAAAPGLANVTGGGGSPGGSMMESNGDYEGGDYDEGGSGMDQSEMAMMGEEGMGMSESGMSESGMGMGMGMESSEMSIDSSEMGMGMGMGSSGSSRMGGMSGYDGGEGGNDYGRGQYGGQQQMGGPGRAPAIDFGAWTRTEFIEAVQKQDRNIIAAIDVQSESRVGDPEFARLMADVLAESTGSGSGGSVGTPGFPAGLEPGGAGRGAGRLVPPGGASLDQSKRLLRNSNRHPIDSIEAMLGESILTYAPQAVQGVRGAGARLQSNVGQGMDGSAMGQPPGSSMQIPNSESMGSPGGMSQPGMSSPGGMNRPGMGSYGSEMEEGNYEGNYQGNGGNPGQAYQPQNSVGRVLAGLTQAELVQAIVSALVKNNSPDAWNTLVRIVDGSAATGLSADENISMVLRDAFTSPALNPEMAEQVLGLAVTQILESPSATPGSLQLLGELSTKPVDHFFGFTATTTSPAVNQMNGQANRIGSGMGAGTGQSGFGMASGSNIPGRPAPSSGGPGLGGMGSASGGMGMGMESGGMGMGSASSGMGMGMESGGYGEGPGYGGGPGYGSGFGGGPGLSGAPVSTLNVPDAGMMPIATVLWSNSTTQKIIESLPSGDPGITALAASIPSASIRHALFEKFKSSYTDGVDGSFSGVNIAVLEPGMLPVLKGLPRLRPAKSNAAQDPTRAPKETWVNATKQVVLALRERLRKAAGNTELAYSGAPKIRLHRGAVPEQSIVIDQPNDLVKTLGASAPSVTKIYYTRTSVTPTSSGQQEALASHYEKNAKGFRRIDLASKMLWFDGVSRNTDGTRQSMDVIIQQDGPSQANTGFGGGNYEGESGGYGAGVPGGFGGPPGGQTAGGAFTIETIVVIVRDPQDPLADQSLTSASLK